MGPKAEDQLEGLNEVHLNFSGLGIAAVIARLA
jgi:hypothetical protein